MSLKDKIDLKQLPRHIAIIMDGNGRWAKKKGKLRTFGHKSGVHAVKDTVEAASELGVEHLTLYAFSTENWNRPQFEINALMKLLVATINKETGTLIKNNIRLSAIGDLKSLPKNCYKELMDTMDKTSGNTKMELHLALSYSARWEIINATKKIAGEVMTKQLSIDKINETLFESHLSSAGTPHPELLIRTSGEYRISNFLLWQIAYAELYFTQKLWPDFRKDDLYDAIIDYQQRERRFGKTSDQVSITK